MKFVDIIDIKLGLPYLGHIRPIAIVDNLIDFIRHKFNDYVSQS